MKSINICVFVRLLILYYFISLYCTIFFISFGLFQQLSIALLAIGMCYAARLDTNYLPPSSAGSAGGPGLIHPPSGHGGSGPIKLSGPGGSGGPSSFGGPSGYGGSSGPSGHGGPGGFGPGSGGGAYAGGKFEQKYNY